MYYDPQNDYHVAGDAPPWIQQRRMPMADEMLPEEQQLLHTQEQVNQASLSQADRNEMQQIQSGMTHVRRDVQAGALSPDEGEQLLRQLGRAARPLYIRASQLPLYTQRLRYQQMQHEMAQQQALEAQNARFQATTAQQRVGTLTLADGTVMNTFQVAPGRYELMPSSGQAPRVTPQLRNTIISQLRRRLDQVNRDRFDNPMSAEEQNQWLRDQYEQTLELIGLGGQEGGPQSGPQSGPQGGGQQPGQPPGPAGPNLDELASWLPHGGSGGQPAAHPPTAPAEDGPPLTVMSHTGRQGSWWDNLWGRGNSGSTRPEINPQATPPAWSPDLAVWLGRLSRHGDLAELHGPSGGRAQDDVQAAMTLLRRHGGRRDQMPAEQRRALDAILRRLGVPTEPANPNAWVAPPRQEQPPNWFEETVNSPHAN